MGVLSRIPARYVLTVVGFLAFLSMSAQRLNIGIAVVAMVKARNSSTNASTTDVCPLPDSLTVGRKISGEFHWTPRVQGLVLGSLGYGFVSTQIPGGRLADTFGAKWVFAVGMLCSTLFSLLTPVLAEWHVNALIAAQVMKGMGQGVLFPSMSTLVGNWMPKSERSFQSSIIYSGIHVGAFLTVLLAGIMTQSGFLGGWQSIFYVPGVLGLVVSFVWMYLVYETPSQHNRISEAELGYLMESKGKDGKDQKKSPIPCRILLTSVPVWALVCGHFGQFWIVSFFTIVYPTYMARVLHFNIKQNGVYSSIPFLLKGSLVWISSFLADWIRRRKFLSVNAIRKTSTTLSSLVSCICILGFTLAGCDRTINVILFMIAYTFGGLMYPGTIITPVDMAPQYAGSIAGLMSVFATMTGVFVPMVVGELLKNEQTLQQWALMFYISIGISLGTTLLFDLFGSARRQPWADVKVKEKTGEESEDISVSRL